MKYASSLVLFLTALVVPRTASASEPEEARKGRETVTLTTSVLTPFFNAYLLESKIRASNSIGVLLNASYLVLEYDDWKTRSATVGAGATYYFQGDALRLWYVEAVAELWFSSQRHEPSGEVAPIDLGYAGVAIVGHQFVWDMGLVLDLGAGAVAFHVPSAEVVTGGRPVTSDALTRVYPAAKVNVGWAF